MERRQAADRSGLVGQQAVGHFLAERGVPEEQVIDQRPQAVKKFLAAYNQAVDEINAHPEAWRKILDQYKLVPAALVQSFPIPKFPAASLPTKQQFDAVVQWALGRGLIDQVVDYASSVKTP